MRTGLAPREHGAVCRFHRNGFELRLALLDVGGDSRKRSAGAYAGDEKVDLAVRIFPDFRAGRLDVNRGIRGIIELLENVAILRFAQYLVGLGDRALHPVGARA